MVSKALIVEHDASTRRKLTRGLKRRGFEVISTNSRAEAFDMLDGDGAHLLVTEEKQGSYRVVFLGDATRGDLEFQPTRTGWKRFDEARVGA